MLLYFEPQQSSSSSYSSVWVFKHLQLEFCDTCAFKNKAKPIVYMHRGKFYGSIDREWAMSLNLSLGLGGSYEGVRREWEGGEEGVRVVRRLGRCSPRQMTPRNISLTADVKVGERFGRFRFYQSWWCPTVQLGKTWSSLQNWQTRRLLRQWKKKVQFLAKKTDDFLNVFF